ncbi:lysine--tRNA ligase [Patescibacteria group bacterium]|nr:lysine--tRNA ligase [Patescibacteria group bacterium]
MSTIDDLINQRKEKIKILEDKGINPYPSKVNKDFDNVYVIKNFNTLENKRIHVAGRIISIREHGKITFFDIEDETSKLQLFFNNETLDYENLSLLDIGDFVEAEGLIFKTKAGEITLKVTNYHILTKSLRPIPQMHFGISDDEEKVRKRYVDLITNKELKEKFYLKSKFVNSFRDFFDKSGFLEVDTPVLELVPGGADAEPFKTYHNTLDLDMYLRISLELHLKRLIVAGFDRVFEIGKVFRNEGMSTQHLQEFTLLEFYYAYKDFNYLKDFVQKLYRYVLKETFGTLKFEYKGEKIDFGKKWETITYFDLMKKYGCDLDTLNTLEKLQKFAKDIGIDNISSLNKARLIDKIYKKIARPNLKGPLFLVGHPIEISPLAKKNESNQLIVDRFQILILGFELGNGFSELNDPIDQKERFIEQQSLRDSGDKEAQMMDEDFIEALEYGMPPTAGFGVGLDRLFMLCANLNNIRETEFFPIIKDV